MFLTNLFGLKRKCMHDKITPDMECGYCPDCGKLIQNEWYITRCACCGVKLQACIKNDEIVPQNHFCRNCGAEEFVVEKLPKINFIDINFAVLKKTVVENTDKTTFTTQCWEERKSVPPKLTVKYL